MRIWQAPFVKQQAPAGCTQGLGLQAVPLPWKVTPTPVHCEAPLIRQVPLGEQHAPGGGHGLVVQVPPMLQTPSVHLDASVIVQLPSGRQQTPGGGEAGHGFGSQAVNSPCQVVSDPAHRYSGATVQFPVRSQQAPDGGWGQRLGSQLIQPMFQTDKPVHPASRVIVQVPFTVQQPPVGDGSGHGLGWHALHCGCQMSPTPAQSASKTTAQFWG